MVHGMTSEFDTYSNSMVGVGCLRMLTMTAQDDWNSGCRRPWILGVLIRVRGRVKLGLSRGIQGRLVGKTAGPLGVLQAFFYLRLYQLYQNYRNDSRWMQRGQKSLPFLAYPPKRRLQSYGVCVCNLTVWPAFFPLDILSTVSPSDQITVQRGS